MEALLPGRPITASARPDREFTCLLWSPLTLRPPKPVESHGFVSRIALHLLSASLHHCVEGFIAATQTFSLISPCNTDMERMTTIYIQLNGVLNQEFKSGSLGPHFLVN